MTLPEPALPPDAPPPDPRFAEAPVLFFVIGAQKCGTTWLSSYMGRHPEICVPAWKEQNYWTMVDGAASPGRALEAYRALRAGEGVLARGLRKLGLVERAQRQKAMEQSLRAADHAGAPHTEYADAIFAAKEPGNRAFGDISPKYALLKPETYREMLELGPEVRFIFIMRDPVARLLSAVRHGLRKKHGRDGVSQELFSAKVARALDGHMDVAFEKSRYDETIARLEAAVPEDRILYLFFEHFFDQGEVDRVCDFLGVASHPAEVEARVHEGAGGKLSVSEADRRAIAERLAPTYRAMRERFGVALPEAWGRSAELALAGAA